MIGTRFSFRAIVAMSFILLLFGCKADRGKTQSPVQDQSDWLAHELPVVKNETAEQKMMFDQADNNIRDLAKAGVIRRIDVVKGEVFVDKGMWSYLTVTNAAAQDNTGMMMTVYILRRIREDRFDLKIIDSSSGEVLLEKNVGTRR